MSLNPALIRESFAVVAPHGVAVTDYFYNYMFSHYPEVRAMFPAQMDAQKERLLNSIVQIVTHIDQLDALVPYLQELGAGHNKYHTQPEHYPIVGASLLATLAHFAGPAWTPAVAEAWSAAYNVAAQVMIEAAEQAAA
ncbi:globin domain-containing protein [Thermithiobacillus tepidarius DSM 3134]|uniref:globin domain-containing protein n=1 Tax=Thermithiobacillus tepidarius TaxID=929 RepID=UPI0004186721|nr:globin domain-containing protein [Thermithiobacillus tepidarius]